MNIFIIHPAFPAQYLYIAPYLANKNKVYFLRKGSYGQIRGKEIATPPKASKFTALAKSDSNLFPLNNLIGNVATGLSFLEKMEMLRKEQNIRPDVIIGHIGWGSLFYCKDMYPNVPVIGYFEWFPRVEVSFWAQEENITMEERIKIRLLQANALLSFELCDVGVTATKWQYSLLPSEYQHKVDIIHEGINTKFCSPAPSENRPGLVLEDIKLNLPEGTEIVTYLSRGFEPMRGFPQFMDAIRLVLKRRPQTHVVIIGKDVPAYSARLKNTTYLKEEEKKGGYPTDRVHFVGGRGRRDYQKILRASSCHVYLTRPFVLSWSCLESMSFACPLVSSKTPPVEEVIDDGVNGLLADFNSPAQIAEKIEEHLDNPERAKKLGAAARETILERFEFTKCAQAYEKLLHSLVH